MIEAKHKIGLRTTKTAIAVFLCLVLDMVLDTSAMDMFYAAIAAIVCMRETPDESLLIGRDRFIGTLLGGILGFGLMNLKNSIPYYDEALYLFVVPLGILICIYVCILINKRDAVVICCVVYLGIALDPMLNVEYTLTYIFMRVAFTTVGIVIATLLNKYFFPYREQ